MKYLISILVGTITTGIFYFSPIFLLSPSPVSAEYWIREMIVIKRNIALTYQNKNKIFILAGSNALFNIDTRTLSNEFNLPVINYGLMGALPLETLFKEISEVAESGDIVILPLEPDSYCKEKIEGYREFEIRNAIAWNFLYWKELSYIDKILAIRFVSSKFPIEIIAARFAQAFNPESIAPRLNALNDVFILNKFNDPQKNIEVSLYSIYNVDTLGNIKNTNDSLYSGSPRRADTEIEICATSLDKIIRFKDLMALKGVKIYFANIPFVKIADLNYESIAIFDSNFKSILSKIAPVLDSRTNLIFPLPFFLNTELHLNSTGRELRTKLLIEAIHKINIMK